MPNDLKGEIHSNFSTDVSTWSNFRSEVTGAYILSGQGGEVGRQHLLREYNRKIDNLSLSGGLSLEPSNAGFSYMGDPFIYNNGGCVGAYSVRTIGFGGPLMRVRRNSDNSEVDVRGDVNGDISLSSPIIDYRENLLTYSEDFSPGYWQKQTCTQVPNAGTDPNGGNTATKIVPTEASWTNVGLVRGWGSTLDNEVYTWSVYVKKGLSDWISFIEGVAWTRLWFNVATGAVGTVGSGWSNATITSVGSGWYRISATVTAGGSNDYLYIIQVDANGGSSVTKDGDKGMLVWGAQLNKGSTLEKYIKTDGSAITELDRPQESFGTFMGTASGYCTTWYDQSATGAAQNNMSNATASQQPMLISAGSLLTENGKPTLSGYGDQTLFGGGIQGTDGGGRPTGTATTLTGDFAFAIVGRCDTSNHQGMLIGDTWDTSGPAIDGSYFWLSADTRMTLTTYLENGGQSWTIDNPIGEQKLWFVRRKSTTVGLSDNGVEEAKTERAYQGNKFSVSRVFGGYGQSYDLSGNLQEVILYNTDQTDTRTAIQTNINNYYNIY